MAAPLEKWDAQTASAKLRRRSQWRFAGTLFIGLLLLSIIASHLAAKTPLNDWARYDGHPFQFIRLIDGRTIAAREPNSQDEFDITLLGIKSFKHPLDPKLLAAFNRELAGETLLLHLPQAQTRDANGQLWADIVIQPSQLLAAELVQRGLSLADRNSNSIFRGEIGRAESQARRKKLGMWAGN